MKIGKIIKKPIITEKSAKMEGANKYCFEVSMSATKGSIAERVTREFGVDVVSVTTMVMPGKSKRIRGTRLFSKRRKFKKAIVELKEGQRLSDFSGGNE